MLQEEFSSFEILEMDIKGKLLTMINKKIMENGWGQGQSAEALGVSQPRISNLKNLHHDKFSFEALLKFADMLGCKVEADCTNGLNLSVDE
jgi:predicted XRE-type DNA-binding protein